MLSGHSLFALRSSSERSYPTGLQVADNMSAVSPLDSAGRIFEIVNALADVVGFHAVLAPERARRWVDLEISPE